MVSAKDACFGLLCCNSVVHPARVRCHCTPLLHLVHRVPDVSGWLVQDQLLNARQHVNGQLRALLEERQLLMAQVELERSESGPGTMSGMQLGVAVDKLKQNVSLERKLYLQLHEVIVKQVRVLSLPSI
jgi:hypothetical protein